MSSFNTKTPTLSDKTKAAYLRRYQSLRSRLGNENGNADLEPEEVVALMILAKPNWSMHTWRQYKASVLHVLETRFPHLDEAMEQLRSESSAGLAKKSDRTSGRKIKQVPDKVWNALQATLRARIKHGHKHAQGLLDVLNATMITGLRPNEWGFSRISVHGETGRQVLRVRNSKHSNGRANGEFRELFIDELSESELATVKAALSYCSAATAEKASQIQLALKNELDVVRDRTIRGSRKPQSSVTIYSFRHQFIANAKDTFDDPVLISALVGHSSTKTAFEHYGKRRNSSSKVRVYPTPESVEAVHKITLELYRDFVAKRGPAANLRPGA